MRFKQVFDIDIKQKEKRSRVETSGNFWSGITQLFLKLFISIFTNLKKFFHFINFSTDKSIIYISLFEIDNPF